MLLESLLSLLLFLFSIVEKLLSIILAHLLLLLLLFLLLILVLIILVFIVLVLLLFILVVLVLLILLVLLVLLVLLFLVLLLPHAESEVVARLIVRWIITQTLLIGFDGIGKELMLLAHYTDVVPHHCLPSFGRLTPCRILKLLYGRTVFLLHQQRTAKIIKRLRIGRVLPQCLTVLYLCLGIVLLTIQTVTTSDKLSVTLRIDIKHSYHAQA